MSATPSPSGPAPPPLAFAPTPSNEKSKRLRWLRWIILVALVAALVAGGLFWRSRAQNSIALESAPVESGSIQARVTATGSLNAVVEVLVSSQVSGNIKALYADWNSRVKKGQLIALIDPEVFQAQLDQATASVHSAHAATLTAQAQLARSHAEESAAAASVRSAQAAMAKDVATETNARGQWQRAQQLFQQQIMSQQDYDASRATQEAATAQVRADQAQVTAAAQSVKSAQASVQVAQNQLASAREQERQAQATLRQAQINLDRTRITAPVDGVVVARRMDVGQTVASTLNPPTIFEIAQDLTRMQVDTNVDESDIGKIAVGQQATFVVDSYPNSTFHGMVSEIRKAPIVTQNVVTYDVVISVSNTDLRLFPGMTANVTILTQRLDNTLKVPNAVLRFRPSSALIKKYNLPQPQPDQAQVYVLLSNRVQAVPVAFGISDGRYTAVTSPNLKAGEKVLVRATSRANTSNPARPQPRMPRM
jgi:HlyD family secretion protein